MMIKNKKADVAITILVVGIMALCVMSLMVFYLSDKKTKSEGFNPVFYSQRVYDMADAVKFSGEGLVDEYDGENLDVSYINGKFVIEKSFYKISRFLKKQSEEPILKIKYSFNP